MRILFFILLTFNIAFGQQEVELCDEPQTFFYSTEANLPGDTEWEVNGQYHYGNPIGLTWSDTGTYNITAIHYSLNCPSEPVTYTVHVTKCEELTYYIPNCFTPDGDESNQTWSPIFTSGFDPLDFHVMVLNRWGQVVWESYDHEIGWDGSYKGKMCQDGTYTWRIDFGDIHSDKRYLIHGHLTLIR
jgi:gliding motility-associated-like protein